MCSNPQNSAVQSILTEAEAILETHPDSALLKLNTIPLHTINELPETDHAHYCLLFTSATDKSYGTHTSDSLISIAAHYYDKQDDPRRKMQVWYTMGRVNQDLGDALRAQKYYLKALEEKELITDFQLIGTIQNNIALLYLHQKVYEKSIPHLKDAVKSFEMSADSLGKSFALRDIGRAFDMLNQQDSMIFYYEKALRYSTKNSSPSIYTELGWIYTNAKNYSKAYEYLHIALNREKEEIFRHSIYLTLGDYFYKTNQSDSAYFYLYKAAESSYLPTQASAANSLVKLAKKEKQWKKCVLLQEEFDVLQDSIYQNEQTESIRKMQYLYDYQQTEQKLYRFELKHANMETKYSLGLLALFILIFLMCLFYYFQHNRRKKALLQQKKLLQLKEHQQEQSLKQMEKYKQQIENLTGETELIELKRLKYTQENAVLVSSVHSQDELIKIFTKSDIYRKFHGISANQITSEDWDLLIEALNLTYDFTNKIKDLLPNISEKKMRACYLTKIEIHPTRMADLLYTTGSNMANIRGRLHKEITGEKESANKFNQFILEMR
jgi:cbb3-type cytochrome oxidase subunit 3